MTAEFEDGDRVRAVLGAIVSDPAYGPQALSNPATLFSALGDYLPDSPDDTGPLLAAAQVDIPRVLRDLADRGLSRSEATRRAAVGLADRTDLPDETSEWAVSQFAVALDLAQALGLPGLPASRLVRDGGSDPGPAAARKRRSNGRGIWLTGMVATIVVVVGIGALLLLRHPIAGTPAGHQADPRARSQQVSSPGSPLVTRTPSRAPASPSPSPSPSPSVVVVSPAQVARDYVADVDDRAWPALWQLGGGMVVLTYGPDAGPFTYSQMVANFEHTVSVSITSLSEVGDTVSVYVDALDTAGVTQHYEIKLLVSGGRIVSGSQYLLAS
jgi:hypothetical protein